MGLIKAAVSAIGSGLADQWLEFLEADEMGEGTVFTGAKAVRPGKGSNTKGSADYVSNGSRIVVQKNQFMMLVDGGKIVDYTAEEGYYTVNNSSAPSLFNGQFGESLGDAFNRIKFGGVPSGKQQVFFINLQEIKGIRFGTPSALNYFDSFYNAELFLRCHGTFSLKISNPILFYQEVVPRDATTVHIDQIKEPQDGRDLKLTIDSRIQYQAFQAVKEAVAAQQAKAGAAVVLDARNGQILALANWPSYNPADRRTLNGNGLRNRAITDLYEPGSTLKVFTAALALDSGRYTPSSLFDAREGFMKIGPDVIRDAHRNKELMTLQQVIQKSSNIGTAKMALSMSPEAHWKMLDAVGIGQAPHIGFPGAAAGRLRPFAKWKPIEHATISYGHGLSVSLLQMARAYTVFAGGGGKAIFLTRQ